MSDLPTPKYQCGSVVYHARTAKVRRDLPCPDCLGTKKWKVVTPAGSELETECHRCNGHMSPRAVASLVAFDYEPVADRLTVGSVRIDTRPFNDSDAVQYMCNETGIGSGSIYNERNLYDSEDAAMMAAKAIAAMQQAEAIKTPERLEQEKFRYLTIRDAALKAADTAVWQSWYRYTNLREDIEASIDEENGASRLSDLREDIQHQLSWDKKHRNSEHDIFEAILDKAKAAAVHWHDEPLLDALAKLPSLKEARRALMSAEKDAA